MTEDLCFFSTIPFEAARKVDVLPEGHSSKDELDKALALHRKKKQP